jgi:5'-nucleotidase
MGRLRERVGGVACPRRVTAFPLLAFCFSLISMHSRFPVTAGFRVEWDSRRPSGQRVISIHLDPEIGESTVDTPTLSPTTPQPTTGITRDPAEEVRREKGGRMYKVVTREYLASGCDGYEMLKGNKYLIEEEGGQMMSAIVRKYLLGESRTGSPLQTG